MKFEPFVSSLENSDTGECKKAQGLRFTLDHESYAGQTFVAAYRTCMNPCCPCSTISFACRSVSAPDKTISFDIDVFKRLPLPPAKSSPDGIALGKAFVAEATSTTWDWLRDFFLGTKRQQMEKADLDALEPDFPSDVIANGSMVGYEEIFPWAEPFTFTYQSSHWQVDDQYCVTAGCKCTVSALDLFRVPETPTESHHPECELYYDYLTCKSELIDARLGSPSKSALMEALRTALPDLEKLLQRRHEQLQRLAHRYREQQSQPVRFQSKPGRNDPCPCGSGRKFKKCCGAG